MVQGRAGFESSSEVRLWSNVGLSYISVTDLMGISMVVSFGSGQSMWVGLGAERWFLLGRLWWIW